MEKCLSSSIHQLSPAIGLRQIFESVASGILLPGTFKLLFARSVSLAIYFNFFLISVLSSDSFFLSTNSLSGITYISITVHESSRIRRVFPVDASSILMLILLLSY